MLREDIRTIGRAATAHISNLRPICDEYECHPSTLRDRIYGMEGRAKLCPEVDDEEEEDMKQDDTSQLSKLGSQGTEYQYQQPDAKMLETFPNQYPNREYTVTYCTKEFTSLCPRTGQPDHATVTVTYKPCKLIVETKSLKLYLFAFRQTGSFMETLTGKIFEDLLTVLSPQYLRVKTKFKARGGITTLVEYQHDEVK